MATKGNEPVSKGPHYGGERDLPGEDRLTSHGKAAEFSEGVGGQASVTRKGREHGITPRVTPDNDWRRSIFE